MRFKQFITERADPNHKTFLEIKTACSQFLAEYSYTPIFRGEKGNKIIISKDVRQDRKPRDTDEAFNAVYNLGAEGLIKVPNVRTQALFATGDPLVTEKYGNMHFIFPVNGYKAIYSEEVDDVANIEHEFTETNDLLEGALERKFGDDLLEDYQSFVQFGPYTLDNLKYYLEDNPKGDQAAAFIMKYFVKFMKSKKYTNKKTNAATDNEILFYNVPSYYAVNIDAFVKKYVDGADSYYDMDGDYYELYETILDDHIGM